MHRLLTLTEQQHLQLPADSAAKGPPSKNKKGAANEALSDKGLVAWWTFEDGPNPDLADIRVDDITGKRFKTLVQRGNDNYGIVPKRTPSREQDTTTTTNNTKTSTKKSGTRKKSAVEYAFSHYDIADEILNDISFLILSQPNLFPPLVEDSNIDSTPTDNAAVGNTKAEELVIAPSRPSSPAAKEFDGYVSLYYDCSFYCHIHACVSV